ncbi:hypothetical protein JRQ81_012140 [Phrynocephalus forsythii]|uniref:Uncharacterized protein n=1 Tax=Phrynocephalus forsythii TaxID=171643 RepID=A0A9Q0X5V9_9SAUR|nr:hypothetical protein JRQ81_012140 [Phrynocephalus forsythii]
MGSCSSRLQQEQQLQAVLLLLSFQHTDLAEGKTSKRFLPIVMARSISVGDLREDALCPICKQFLTDPVLMECGHNFCRICISEYYVAWKELSGPLKCPVCGAPIQEGRLRPNQQLGSLVEKLKLIPSFEEEKDYLCPKHQEKLNLFCENDEELICVICERSPEHESHKVLLAEEAAQGYKDKMHHHLRTLKVKRSKTEMSPADAEKETVDLLKRIQTEKEKAVSDFKKFHAFLEEQEDHLLDQMKELQKDVAKKRRAHLTKLAEEVSSLKNIIQEMEESCEQPAVGFLSDYRTNMEKCDRAAEDPDSFPLELKWRVCDELWYQDFQCKKDSKSVRMGEFYRSLPRNPERFDEWPFVLGCEGFVAGRHYWEVEVGREDAWGVGVAKKSARRHGDVDFSPKEGFWAVGRWEGNYTAYNPPYYTLLTLHGELKRMRVSLNVDGGWLTFFDADTAAPLFAYSVGSFSGETLFPFFYSQQEEKTKVNFCSSMAVATRRSLRGLSEEATCSICLEYFKDPVTIECGHNFCQGCLAQTWKGSEGRNVSCPECRKGVRRTLLIPNWQLASLAEKLSRLEGEKAPERNEMCEKHQEPIKLFCQDEETLLCVVCDRSKEHRGHLVVPLEEAAPEYQELITDHLELLKKERATITKNKAEIRNESRDLLKKTKAEMKKMKAEFRKLHQFLEKQENLLVAQLEETEKEIARKREEHLARFSEELSSLQGLIQEMEQKRQQPPRELLQDLSLLSVSLHLLKCLNGVALLTLNSLFLSLLFPHPHRTLEASCRSKWIFLFLLVLHSAGKANVTLDPETADKTFVVSEDRKSVSYGNRRQHLSDNPQRFDTELVAFGKDWFTAGRHYWEVVVGREEQWLAGVTQKSVERKGRVDWNVKGGFVAVGKWSGRYVATSQQKFTRFSPGDDLERIRVSLNCAAGRISFYNADTAAHLHTFSEASFVGETFLPLFYVARKARVTITP